MTIARIEDCYRRYGAMVLRRARAILKDEAAAKDAMQEVFVRAMKAQSTFLEVESPVTWLYAVTTHCCFTLLRNQSRRASLLNEQGVRGDSGAHESSDDALIAMQLLERAPEDLRQIAIYYYLDQMSHEEIAGLLNVSRRTVGNRLEQFKQMARSMDVTLEGES